MRFWEAKQSSASVNLYTLPVPRIRKTLEACRSHFVRRGWRRTVVRGGQGTAKEDRDLKTKTMCKWRARNEHARSRDSSSRKGLGRPVSSFCSDPRRTSQNFHTVQRDSSISLSDVTHNILSSLQDIIHGMPAIWSTAPVPVPSGLTLDITSSQKPPLRWGKFWKIDLIA